MQVTMQAKELTDVEVKLVSLVKHGAIRAPYKIIKSDDESKSSLEKNFDKFFATKTEIQPVAVLTKVSKAKEVAFSMIDSGYELDAKEALVNDDSILFKMEGYDGEIDGIMPIAEDVMIGFKNIEKGFSPYGVKEFSEVLASISFIPNIRTASEVLGDEIAHILYESDKKSESRKKVADAIKMYNEYVMRLIDQLPESVFKLEKELNSE